MAEVALQGVLPVAAAPFRANGEVDYDGLKQLADFEIKAGAAGITLFGFATEFYKLSENEKSTMLQVVVNQVAGRIPVVASVTEQCTELAVRKAKEFQDLGADALMVLPPFIIPAGKTAFIQHVQAVAQAVQVPVMVQYSPQETGVAIDAKTLSELMAGNNNLKYLKIECKPPGPMITDVLGQSSSGPQIFVGYAGLQMMDAFRRGAVGVMPGSSFTDIYCRIYRLYQGGQIQAALDLHNKLIPFLNVIFQSIEMIIKWEKIILQRRGIIESDYCRCPQFVPDAAGLTLFNEFYQKIATEFTV